MNPLVYYRRFFFFGTQKLNNEINFFIEFSEKETSLKRFSIFFTNTLIEKNPNLNSKEAFFSNFFEKVTKFPF